MHWSPGGKAAYARSEDSPAWLRLRRKPLHRSSAGCPRLPAQRTGFPQGAADAHTEKRENHAKFRSDLAACRRPRPEFGGGMALADRIWGMRRSPTRISLGARAYRDAEQPRLPREGESRGHPHRGDGRVRRGGPIIAILGEYDACRPQPGRRHRRTQGSRSGRPRPWLRSQPARLRRHARGHRDQGLARCDRHPGPRALLSAALRKKAARPNRSWCGPASSTASTSPSPGIRPRSHGSTKRCRSPIRAWTSSSPAAPATPPPPPHLGRSALDAVELMNVAPTTCVKHIARRCPYPLRDAGFRRHRPQRGAGLRQGALRVRSRDLLGMFALNERVIKVAEGAALMSGPR